MNDYILNITLAKGSGEYSICECFSFLLSLCSNVRLAHLLAPGAVARMPIVNRISAVKVPVTFVCKYTYRLKVIIHCGLDGDHDWMDPKGGVDSVYMLREAGNHRCKTVIIPHSGHHGSNCFTLMRNFTNKFVCQCTWITQMQ
jgi:cardiolipin-specific phospholipase